MEWIIVYKKYTKAVDMVNATVEYHLGHGINCSKEEMPDKNILYIGVDESLKEGFKIKVTKPDADGRQRIEITACDEINLMYAATDFKNKYLPYSQNLNTHMPYYFSKLFVDEMKEYDVHSVPKIKQRGIWTWGYVIYDYIGFIDNMVKLKLNTLIVWNDYVPANIKEVIDYAHQNGIKIYLGFAWGWDTMDTLNISDISNTDGIAKDVLCRFEKDYVSIGCDGIYFQSFTEVTDDNINGTPVAETVTKFVNNIGGKILEKYPETKLLFGLHATSVRNKLDIIKCVDDRISIIWEDCGAFPYAYTPYDIKTADETLEFTKKIRDLRAGGGFGAVLKGVICLDWTTFEHQKGEFVLGKADKKFIEKKAEEKKKFFKYVQAYWIKNAKYAQDVVKEYRENDMVTVLCEDGLLEESINYPMAVFADMMWDYTRPTDDILCEVALSPDVELA